MPANCVVRRVLVILIATGEAGATDTCDNLGYRLQVGNIRICPSGFLSYIGTVRSNAVNPSISTALGSIPLGARPSQALGSFGTSRISVETSVAVPGGLTKVYDESDFLDTPGQNPYRLRQLWGEYTHGSWSVLAGQAWSLVRLNRKGVSSESEVFDTDVLDPAYQGNSGVEEKTGSHSLQSRRGLAGRGCI